MTEADLDASKWALGYRTRSRWKLNRIDSVQEAKGPGSEDCAEGMVRKPTRRRGVLDIAVRAVLPITLALGVESSAHAEGKWSFKLEPMYMDAYGHDQHVLTIHEIDLNATPRLDNKTALSLDTDADIAYRAEIQYRRGQWGLGADYFLYLTAQSGEDRTAAPSGAIDEVVFEVADRRFTSSNPNNVLFHGVLEDTDLEVWTADLYGIRTLSEASGGGLDLQLGLRVGDFDNDYHGVVGIQGAGGSLLDSSSNYGLMLGPLVALSGNIRLGRSYIEGYIGQSVLLGDAELSSMSREFTGAFTGTPTIVSQEVFRKEPSPDVAIPITEFRIKWTYELSQKISLGVGAHTSTWWDVPVPPGIIPIEDGDETLHENTIVFFGLLGGVKFTF